MRRRVLRMLSTGSLSAFSNANLIGPGVGGVGGTGITPVRDVRLAPAAPAAAPLLSQPPTPPASPGQVLPRGSLLNLSI